MKLFCFSHAGGSAVGFSRWKRLLDSRISLHLVELNGRGVKANLPFYPHVDEAVADLAASIMAEAGDAPYAFIGHSMGTVIAYEICHYLKSKNFREPEFVFFSGRQAPHIKEEKDDIHLLSDAEFIEEIKLLGHSPAELFASAELLKFFIPILKADYRMLETYVYRERADRLTSKFIIMTGSEDVQTHPRIEEWTRHIEGSCDYYRLKGGHFFLYVNTNKVLELIHKYL